MYPPFGPGGMPPPMPMAPLPLAPPAGGPLVANGGGGPSRIPPHLEDGLGSVDLVRHLAGRRVGETIHFPTPVAVGSERFTHGIVERIFGTASGAQLVRLLPRGMLFVLKFEDVTLEHAAMCALRHMNQRWRRHGVTVCGVPVEAVTYLISPLGRQAGLIQAVPDSATLRELSDGVPHDQRHLRVLSALRGDARRLDKLAASTAAYLTAGYALGVRDGHDDNIMLRGDGALFRVDFGYLFGRTPEVDAPGTIIPRTVAFALGEQRWAEVITGCAHAMAALSGPNAADPLAFECLRGVPELSPVLAEAHLHLRGRTVESFCRDVRRADEWSLSRAAKNTLRDMKRYVLEEVEVPASDDWFGLFDGSAFGAAPTSPNSRDQRWGRPPGPPHRVPAAMGRYPMEAPFDGSPSHYRWPHAAGPQPPAAAAAGWLW